VLTETVPEAPAPDAPPPVSEEGKKVDDCQKAPNPLVPAANEIIWGGAAFAYRG